MIGMLRPSRMHDPLVSQSRPRLGCFWGDLQPLTLPDPLDPRAADQPAGITQQRSDLAVAIAAVLPGQFDYVGRQPCRILSAPRDLTLRRGRSETCKGSLLQNELIKRQIGNSPAKSVEGDKIDLSKVESLQRA